MKKKNLNGSGYKMFRGIALSDKAFKEKYGFKAGERSNDSSRAVQTSKLTPNELEYVSLMTSELLDKVPHNKISTEKLAAKYGITDKVYVKELTEYAIIKASRKYALLDVCPKTGLKASVRDKFDKIVEIYQIQPNLSLRTSVSMSLQQYSTPAPLAYVMGEWIKQGLKESQNNILEPTAGTGLLTIAFDLKQNDVIVNEIDRIRLEILKDQGFYTVTDHDATEPFYVGNYGRMYDNIDFDAIIANPPFGSLEANQYQNYGTKPDQFTIKTLDHLIMLRALDLMKPDGRAAFIIGGHTAWDNMGRVQAGKNRIFLNYLYRYYNVTDIINIDGHKLYSRQGTAFDVRMILINGRKPKPDGFSPLKQPHDVVVYDFDMLFDRVFGTEGKQILRNLISNTYDLELIESEAIAKIKILNLQKI